MASHVSSCMALLKPINMGVPIQFGGQQDSVRGSSKKKKEEGKREREKRKREREERKGEREEKKRKGKKKREEGEKERKKKEEKEGVLRNEQTRTVKNPKLLYKR